MTRQEKIKQGKIWQVWRKNDSDNVLFEGSRTACIKYLKEQGLYRLWKRGKADVSLGELISENIYEH
jgi:hypothetical protein